MQLQSKEWRSFSYYFHFYFHFISSDDRRSEQPCGSVPAAAHPNRSTERFARSQRKNQAIKTSVCRVLQAHQPAPPATDTQVIYSTIVYSLYVDFMHEQDL